MTLDTFTVAPDSADYGWLYRCQGACFDANCGTTYI